MEVSDIFVLLVAAFAFVWCFRFIWRRWGMRGMLGPFLYPYYTEYQKRNLRFPFATAFIVLALVTTYFLEPSFETMLDPHSPFYGWILTSDFIALRSLIFAQFSHLDLGHLLTNVFALIVIGSLLEIWIGWRRYLFVYFIAGTIGLAVGTSFAVPHVAFVGASGNISAIMGAYIVRRVYWERDGVSKSTGKLFLGILFVFLYFFGLDIFELNKDSTVAHGIHLCGALAGILSALFYEWHTRPNVNSSSELEPIRKIGNS